MATVQDTRSNERDKKVTEKLMYLQISFQNQTEGLKWNKANAVQFLSVLNHDKLLYSD